MSEDICGSTATTSGEPCKFTPGASCPYHDTDSPPDTGRPSKLDLERQEEIAQAIENGKSVASAARMAGVHPSTVYRWLDKGEDQDEGAYHDFRERYMRARGHGLNFYESNIIELALAEGDIPSLMTLMRQQYPDAYGEAKRADQAGQQVEVYLTSEDAPQQRELTR